MATTKRASTNGTPESSIVLSGKRIDIDMSKISIREWRALLDVKQPDEEEFATIAKITGMDPEDVANMPQPDFVLLGRHISMVAANPVSDPN
jgi:hypothetical protein